MKITDEKLEISQSTSIEWKDVDNMRLSNDKLCLVLSSGKVIELDHIRPTTIDAAFRAYEHFLKEHPEKRQHKRR